MIAVSSSDFSSPSLNISAGYLLVDCYLSSPWVGYRPTEPEGLPVVGQRVHMRL